MSLGFDVAHRPQLEPRYWKGFHMRYQLSLVLVLLSIVLSLPAGAQQIRGDYLETPKRRRLHRAMLRQWRGKSRRE